MACGLEPELAGRGDDSLLRPSAPRRRPLATRSERPGAGVVCQGAPSGRYRAQQGVTESMVKPCPVTAASLVICTCPLEVGTQAEVNPPGMLPV